MFAPVAVSFSTAVRSHWHRRSPPAAPFAPAETELNGRFAGTEGPDLDEDPAREVDAKFEFDVDELPDGPSYHWKNWHVWLLPHVQNLRPLFTDSFVTVRSAAGMPQSHCGSAPPAVDGGAFLDTGGRGAAAARGAGAGGGGDESLQSVTSSESQRTRC